MCVCVLSSLKNNNDKIYRIQHVDGQMLSLISQIKLD